MKPGEGPRPAMPCPMVSGSSLTVACMSSDTPEAPPVDHDGQAPALGARVRSTPRIGNRESVSTRGPVPTACAWLLAAAAVLGIQHWQSPPAQIMAPAAEPALHLQASSLIDPPHLLVPTRRADS